jgi:hypothetical protein
VRRTSSAVSVISELQKAAALPFFADHLTNTAGDVCPVRQLEPQVVSCHAALLCWLDLDVYETPPVKYELKISA